MRKFDVGQVVAVLANVGVIAGIVFLGYELRQNNELLAAQASFAQFSVERDRRESIYANTGGIAGLITRDRNGTEEPLTQMERLQLTTWCRDAIDSWQWQWRENQANRLSDDFLNIEDWRGVWLAVPRCQETYRNSTNRRDAAFLEFMDEHVISVRPTE